MSRDDNLYLEDIFWSIIKIEEYLKSVQKEDFDKDTKLQDAVIRRLEIIGEASKNISNETKDHAKEVPWKEISGFRDFVSHSYFGVNIERVWKVIEKDLPELKSNLIELKNKLKQLQE